MKALMLCLPSVMLLGLVLGLLAGSAVSPTANASLNRRSDCACVDNVAPVKPVLPRGGI